MSPKDEGKPQLLVDSAGEALAPATKKIDERVRDALSRGSFPKGMGEAVEKAAARLKEPKKPAGK